MPEHLVSASLILSLVWFLWRVMKYSWIYATILFKKKKSKNKNTETSVEESMENMILSWAVPVKYSHSLSQTATLVVTYTFFSKYITESSVKMLFIGAKIDNTCCAKLRGPFRHLFCWRRIGKLRCSPWMGCCIPVLRSWCHSSTSGSPDSLSPPLTPYEYFLVWVIAFLKLCVYSFVQKWETLEQRALCMILLCADIPKLWKQPKNLQKY